MVVANPYHANERHDARLVPFPAGDGLELNLVHIRGEREATRGPVMLVHGAGVRANIFRAPVERTIVDALVEDGYDVWLENWRASIDFAAERVDARPGGASTTTRRPCGRSSRETGADRSRRSSTARARRAS